MLSDLNSKNTKEFKSLLYEITRETINKEFPIENYFNVIESIQKVKSYNFRITEYIC